MIHLLAAYKPFLHPAPIWNYWVFLAIPLTLGVSVVYKSIRCRHMRQVPREALSISFWILITMLLAAGALSAIGEWVRR